MKNLSNGRITTNKVVLRANGKTVFEIERVKRLSINFCEYRKHLKN